MKSGSRIPNNHSMDKHHFAESEFSPLQPAASHSSRPSAGLLMILVMGTAGVAIGVPWAVFRYAPNAGIAEAWQVALAAIGIIGGCGAMNTGVRGLLRPRN